MTTQIRATVNFYVRPAPNPDSDALELVDQDGDHVAYVSSTNVAIDIVRWIFFY